MFRRLGILLAALALFTVAGGHWAVLQSVAWAQMLRTYSQDATVSAAIAKTFSGQYPCGLCRKIAEAKKTEEQKAPEFIAAKKSPEFLAARRSMLPAPFVTTREYPRVVVLDPGSAAPEPAVPVPLRA
ncbi:MAG TPA: hypothetical protein VIM61_14860 [Chthoniobacterales bacterium]|jgi:hypothetical protein